VIEIILNGEPYRLPEKTMVGDLIAELRMKPARVALELNDRVIAKADYLTTRLAAGDRVEIVNFVGGG
jgi:thiamine biosynthesis protein ThiS